MILVGTALGVTLLVNLPRAAGMLLLGLFVLWFAIFTLFPQHYGENRFSALGLARRARRRHHQHPVRRRRAAVRDLPLAARPVPRSSSAPRMGFATLTSISLRLCAFLLTGLLLDADVWLKALAVVPACLLGIWVARKIFLRISREALMRAVALLLLASGASLIFRAVL